ncbi:MAG: GNAT family N-acetyltransferase [Rhodobacteraceae bacterium]|nr:GNAT family N-acetyltransferase [Paracoccaceae bacterium]
MSSDPATFQIRLAQDERDYLGAQRCRYDVFVKELGSDGALVDHARRLEADEYDPFYEHMILVDPARDDGGLDHVVGVYRLMRGDQADAAGGFYTAGEYDLAPLLAGGRKLLELGRSCLRPEYRGGSAMFHIWNGLAAYTLAHGIEILFGTASFHGTDPEPLAAPLSLLHHRHLAPPDLRVRTLPQYYQSLDRLPEGSFDRAAAMRAVPALIKGYLRLGGFVGDGAFVDHAFNTTDVCLVLDVERMSPRQRAIYTRGLDG